MKVVHIQRRRPPERFSIEGYFERVRAALATDVDVRVYVPPFFSRGLFRRLWNMVAVIFHQADVNHVTGDIHYATLLLNPRRTVLTVHDCEILNRLSGWQRWIVKCFWYDLPAKRVSTITVNSSETKKRLLEVISFAEDNITVVPVSVSTLYRPVPRKFDSQCPRILQIGTKANKNLDRLAEALCDIKCEVHIVGPMTDLQQNRFEQHGIAVVNHQFLSDEELFELYCNSDIVSFVSTYEGFGMPIVEAQRVGRVCVTSNCSSMPEVAGDGACFVDPYDVQSIREGFLKVIEDVEFRESVIEKGRTNSQRFDADEIARMFTDVYQSVYTDSVRKQSR